MKRIDVHYGGELYTIGGRDVGDLQAEILAGLAAGGCWLSVNDGEGARRDAQLLLHAGVPITLIPVPDPTAEIGETP